MANRKEESPLPTPITGPAPVRMAEQLVTASEAVLEAATKAVTEPTKAAATPNSATLEPVCYPTDFLRALGINIGHDGDVKRYDGDGNPLN